MELLKVSGVEPEIYRTEKVKCDEEGNYLHTITMDTGDNLPLLVMIHGYGGTGLIFFKLFKELLKHFRIVTIDLIGMGGSS